MPHNEPHIIHPQMRTYSLIYWINTVFGVCVCVVFCIKSFCLFYSGTSFVVFVEPRTEGFADNQPNKKKTQNRIE